ncbi:hypothetical protein K469DRAFT_569572 [Zopfia rhizophila CBS 207.26]|uniref:HNH nuclease domain-containing protein n=1 Tax=Zopfia rhizophila CBS 207.26 TaxID=1314779 RepID=A0A6A6E6G6_9PEZI|nr:hypothetical protein K469DRAFT_569572 [Zopfia rhizophila CBS 207.26]
MASSSSNLRMPESIEHFTERSQERSQAFSHLISIFKTESMPLPPVVWAFFQVADLEMVETMVPRFVRPLLDEGTLETMCRNAILLWRQGKEANNEAGPSKKRNLSSAFGAPDASNPTSTRTRPDPTPLSKTKSGQVPSSTGSNVRRSKRAAAMCRERDNHRCIASKCGEVDACHIYPWCAFGGNNMKRVDKFWLALEMFWPEEKVKSWRKKIFRSDIPGTAGTETVENMVSLTATLHRFHSAGAFALRPVHKSDDGTRLELEFHWLVVQQRDPAVELDLLTEPLSSRDRIESSDQFWFARRDENGTVSRLCSGDRFEMVTDDPVNKPLPDAGLLEMQWHLQRILAMSGAAGWREEDFDRDSAADMAMPAAQQTTDDQVQPDVVETVEKWLDDQDADIPSESYSNGDSEAISDGELGRSP